MINYGKHNRRTNVTPNSCCVVSPSFWALFALYGSPSNSSGTQVALSETLSLWLQSFSSSSSILWPCLSFAYLKDNIFSDQMPRYLSLDSLTLISFIWAGQLWQATPTKSATKWSIMVPILSSKFSLEPSSASSIFGVSPQPQLKEPTLRRHQWDKASLKRILIASQSLKKTKKMDFSLWLSRPCSSKVLWLSSLSISACCSLTGGTLSWTSMTLFQPMHGSLSGSSSLLSGSALSSSQFRSVSTFAIKIELSESD